MSTFYGKYAGILGGGGGATGVTSLNSETGDIILVAGSNITITPSGQNITIAASFTPSSGNLTDTGTDGIVITGGTGAVLGSGTSIAQHVADSTHNGYLSSTDWSTFNSKQSALTLGNITDVGTDGIVITGGTGAIIGSGVTLAQHVADTTHNGYLSSTDWNTFNSKGSGTVTAVSVASANGFAGSSSGGSTPALTLSTTITGILQGNGTAISAATTGNLTAAGTDGIVITSGSGAVLGSGTSIAQHVADSTHNGYLTSTDWSTFNSKGSGSVTSVGLSVPATSILGVTGSPVTTSGTLGLTTTGTSGGIPYFSSTSALSSSALLTTNALVLGGGAGSAPTPMASLGTTTTVLHGNASGAPTYAPVSLTADVSGTLPVTNGGTGVASTTAYAVLCGGTTSTGVLQSIASVGSSGQVLTSNGPGALPTFQPASAGSFTAPTSQQFLSTGTTTGYLFTVTSANATVGATYTNNGHTYTVLGTISAGTQLFTSQASAPAASGTLTKATGSGDSTITFASSVALGTYTTPASVLYLEGWSVGGGGGGGGGGSTGARGGNATDTRFGANLIQANGGTGGLRGVDGGVGGSVSLGTAYGDAVVGGSGAANGDSASSSGGGQGAAAPFYAGGGQGAAPGIILGGAGITNTGAGGGGGGATSGNGGSGGASGGGVHFFINNPAASYPYVIGTGGAAGIGSSAGSNDGGAGAAGRITIIERYQ